MYSITYNCENCGHSFSKDFQKGVKAPSKVECKRCGCFTAFKKTWPERITVRDFISIPTPRHPIRPIWPTRYEWPREDYQRWDSNRTNFELDITKG
jgi:DNA-directed RNA polymerase subunit RPC12/RpoP